MILLSSKYTQAQNEATNRYLKKTYDQISIRVKKGKKEEYTKKAAAAGKTLKQYIVDFLESGPK